MALTFGGATSDVVNCGSAASLDNLTNRTWLVWAYPTTLTSGKSLCGKSTNPTAAHNRMGLSGTGQLRVFVGCTTTGLDFITNNAALTTNKWWCIATSIEATGLTAKIYRGDLTTALTECTYGTSIAGVGTFSVDDTTSFLLGNDGFGSNALPGRLATAVVWNRALSLEELQEQQFRPHVTSGCVLLMHLGWTGTGIQRDWSGNANTGTVTGATVADHVPLGPPVLGRHRGSYRVSAVAAAGLHPWAHGGQDARFAPLIAQ